ncbi:magnesium transporter MRS2-F-like [Zingiber officinale]|uniref:magnesium transporter MRS2-F-like n=1 Tax=Zingiber officinale TaxID=94328 RepID=UPI001C4AB90E|nr:magnesium transporter MRS2-F-like [Zingiber officinale]
MATRRARGLLFSRVATANDTPLTAVAGRRNPSSIREWMVISASGCSYQEEAGKLSIMHRTGIPARDLRVLDTLLSYPSTILGRERAIVISLEHIRAIITATEVLVPNSKDPLVAPFVRDLQSRIFTSASPPQLDVGISRSPSYLDTDGLQMEIARDASKGCVTLQRLMANDDMKESSPQCNMDEARYLGTKILPFEFRALEVCLVSACEFLELETTELEKEAYPASDELTSKLSTLNLERVRQIKSCLVALSGRVQKVRDEIECLLDNEMDIAGMYLTEKLLHRPVGASARFGMCNNVELDDERNELESNAGSSNGGIVGFNPDIHELEMLLEAYFVQIDGTLRKLSTLKEYMDDTEDYIKIMLDDKQNQLLQMGVMLTTATVVTTAAIVVTAVFGMNIHIPLYKSSPIKFWQTLGSLIGGGVVLYIFFFWRGTQSGLLQ